MAISYVSGAAAAAATVAMPTHQAGDMIIVFAFKDNGTTLPTVPAGYTGFQQPSTGSAFSAGFKIAASGSEATGTWTNATSIVIAVYRITSPQAWTTPVLYFQTGTGTMIDYTLAGASYFGAFYTTKQTNTEVWNVRFVGHQTATNLTATTPSGWTARAAGGDVRAMDTNGPTTINVDSVGGNSQTVNTSATWITVHVRLEAWNGTGMVCMGVNSTGAASASLPINAAGDLMLGYSSRANNTAPSLPAGYTNLTSGGVNTLSHRIAYKIATASETAPTFTNGTTTSMAVYRNDKGTIDGGGLGTEANGLSTTVSWTNAPVNPVSGQVTKFIRYVTFAGTGFLNGPSNWTDVAAWPTPAPALGVYTADGLVDADSIGTNTETIPSMAWRTATIFFSYNPNSYENISVANKPVPSGVTGCYVSLIGGGGGGASGATRNGSTRPSGYGGGGGGGGGAVRRAFVPLSLLGSTYSVTVGTGGAATTAQGQNGNDGTASTFTSGSVTISAGGGLKGVQGLTPSGGAGGTTSVTAGITYDTIETGGAGGAGSTTASNTGAGAGSGGTTYAGAGGGGGGTNISSAYNGAAGGSSTVGGGSAGSGAGGGGGTGTSASLGFGGGGGGGGAGGSGASNGGTGGGGGSYGAGGGGGGGKEGSFSGRGGLSGAGAPGYTLVEWVPVNPGQFFSAYELF